MQQTAQKQSIHSNNVVNKFNALFIYKYEDFKENEAFSE